MKYNLKYFTFMLTVLAEQQEGSKVCSYILVNYLLIYTKANNTQTRLYHKYVCWYLH